MLLDEGRQYVGVSLGAEILIVGILYHVHEIRSVLRSRLGSLPAVRSDYHGTHLFAQLSSQFLRLSQKLQAYVLGLIIKGLDEGPDILIFFKFSHDSLCPSLSILTP